MAGKKRSKQVEPVPVEPLETWAVIDKSKDRVAWPGYRVVGKQMTLTAANTLAKTCDDYRIICFKVKYSNDPD